MILFLLGLSLVNVQFSDGYVLLQVRKQDDNHSNVDALIHKVVPSDKIQQFAQKMARKQYHARAQNDEISSKSSENKIENGGNEEISLSVDDKSDPVLIKLVDLAIQHFIKPSGPVMRSNDQANAPRKIKFRTGESSVLYEINSQSLIKGLRELLSSKIVRRYLDQLTRKAAVVYRSMRKSK